MTTIEVKIADVLNDYPEIVEEYMNNIRQSNISKHKDIDVDDIRWFYSYGFFVSKAKDDGERMTRDTNNAERASRMLFDERLEWELSKVRVDVTMKASNFIRGDRAKKGIVPRAITELVTEITKIKMLVEQKYYQYMDVVESIPAINPKLIPQEELDKLNEILNGGQDMGGTSTETTYEIDDILDKISEKGMDSLDEGEMKFLKKISNDTEEDE